MGTIDYYQVGGRVNTIGGMGLLGDHPVSVLKVPAGCSDGRRIPKQISSGLIKGLELMKSQNQIGATNPNADT